MLTISPSAIKAKADAYIDERTRTSGVPFPFVGEHRQLAIMLMAGFACVVLADELAGLLAEKEGKSDAR
mgnify:CR=1 FL=1